MILTKRSVIKIATVAFSTVVGAVAPALLQQCKSLFQAKLVHQQILVQDLTHHLSTNLIASYIALNFPSYAVSLLERLLPSPTAVFSWNVVIRHFILHGLLLDVLVLARNMKRLCFSPDHYTFPFVLKACGDIPSFRSGASVHGLALVSGFEWNVFVCNALVRMYSRSGGLDEARQMFNEMCKRSVFDVVSWNSIVSAYMVSGEAKKALEMFQRMRSEFGVYPDIVSLVHVLPACAAAGACLSGREVHCFAIRNGSSENVFVGNAFVTMYAKCGRMDEAGKVFERMKVKDVVSWNAMVTGYSQIGRLEEALGLLEKMREGNLELNVVTWSAVIAGYAQRGLGNEAVDVFRKMQFCGSKPNVITLISVLSACASSGALLSGKEIHSYTIKCMSNIDQNNAGEGLRVINSLIDMYAKCGRMDEAGKVFERMKVKDVVSWTAMVTGYSQIGRLEETLGLLEKMREGNLELNVVTWSAVIAGYAQRGLGNEAVDVFRKMQFCGSKPDVITLISVLSACASSGALLSGKEIHSYTIKCMSNIDQNNAGEDLMVINSLINMYAKCWRMDEAGKVFERMKVKDVVSWTAMVTGYSQIGRLEEALGLLEKMREDNLELDVVTWNALIAGYAQRGLDNEAVDVFRKMQFCGSKPSVITLISVLSACASSGALLSGKEIHSYTIKCMSNIDHNNAGEDLMVINSLINMYAKCWRMDEAGKVFERMKVKDVVSWNMMVIGYSQIGRLEEALGLFEKKREYNLELDVVTWSALIAGYAQRGLGNEAVAVFRKMQFCGSKPNVITLMSVLSACASSGALLSGKEIHSYTIKCMSNIDQNNAGEYLLFINSLINMYAKCGRMDEAGKVFERMKVKDVVSWTAMVTGYSQIGRLEEALGLLEKMREDNLELDVVTWSALIAGYAQRGLGNEAVDVFRKMQFCGSKPNVITLISVLSACASSGALLSGKEIHSYTIKCMSNIDQNNAGEDLMVINSLINMYAKCKTLHVARAIFDSTTKKDRNVVTWTVMIGGYAQNGEANDALRLLSEMLKELEPLKPNAFTISCALMACAALAAERFGKQIHAHVLRNKYENGLVFLENCLLEMYSNSGNVAAARVVFDNMQLKNSVSWTSLLKAYGMHGMREDVVKVFDEMQRAGLAPDGITLRILLYACCHSTMVDEGIRYFNNMHKDFGVIPELEHYSCMVDILGRAGRLDEALKLINIMPMEPAPIVWVALLSGCRIHGNIELGEYAFNRLLELDSMDGGSYKLLLNIYASARRWKDVAQIRSSMNNSGIKKRPGCSWIQGMNGTAIFYVGGRTHPQSEEIYELLGDLIHRIKGMGYVPERSFALHDVDDEQKDDHLLEHSEKLALAYGILTSSPGVPIRITKNLRVCGDCHSAFTYISMIIDNKIVLRDSSRFHHFKSGTCSCRGYW